MFADQLINNASTETCAPVMAAVARDLKQYMRLRHQATGQRILPIASGTGGNNTAQDGEVLEYLVAGEKADRFDFWTVRIDRPLKVPTKDELTCSPVQVLRLLCTARRQPRSLERDRTRDPAPFSSLHTKLLSTNSPPSYKPTPPSPIHSCSPSTAPPTHTPTFPASSARHTTSTPRNPHDSSPAAAPTNSTSPATATDSCPWSVRGRRQPSFRPAERRG